MVKVCFKETVNNFSIKLCPVEFEQSLNILLFHLTSICTRVGTPSHLNYMLSLAQVLIVNVKTFQSHNNDTVEENDT